MYGIKLIEERWNDLKCAIRKPVSTLSQQLKIFPGGEYSIN